MTITHPARLQPLTLSLEEFLCGAEGAEGWLSQHFDDYIHDIDKTWHAEDRLMLRDGYSLAPSSDSMLLLYEDGGRIEVAGYYNTPGAVCIADEHQGQGLGAELVLATALWYGGAPTEGLDEQAFTEAGYAAHCRAWQLGVERGLIVDPDASPAFSPSL